MTSAHVHEQNAITVKGRKINWFESYYYDSWQVAKIRKTEMKTNTWLWVSFGKKIGFNSSEMAKKCVSISHKVERSFIYFVHYSFWKSYSYWPCSFSESDCLLPLWKVQIVWLKKNLYMDIVALGFDHFMTSLSMVKIFSPSFVSLFVFFFLTYTDLFFFQLRTCVRA